MKAVVYQKFGTINELQVIERSIPSIGEDQVLVKVKAFSINPMDWKIRKGEMTLMSGSKFPKQTGADFAGVVETAGSAVNHLKKGDEVFGVVKNMMKEGVSAEYIAVPSSFVWKKPSNLSFPQAASIPVVGTAAMTAIEKMGTIGSHTRILVNGATGGFGMFLLQLLKSRKAIVTAVASTKGLDIARQWGADEVIDYTKENVMSRKAAFDVVIDLSGKMSYQAARQIMKSKGRFLNPVPKPIDIPWSIVSNLFTAQKQIVVLSSPAGKYIKALLVAIENGLEIKVDKVFSFADYKEAYQYAEQGGYIGKVVVALD
ncbi:NAD(P)-dependent alcohol dehydrogenase [Mucilaginibacter lacusdianchii]|uniref:NAD(P)-dependent alcohol dehydrogenase n=1 Tax=Mucilaginibacter lacusdianchii TaxID=2684211 RepID=UPI00131D41DC|nr:NAD(P)-dependent alcohol dehydrogenase [Mucilaginibacter sp. JXJ CY 39]